MLKMKGNKQNSGVYRTRDSIENLQVRVSLRKLYSIIKIPKFEAFQSNASDHQASTDFEEIVTVQWQQKLFSKAERAYYAQKENCKTELEKQYHQMIKDSSNGDEGESGMIFTYTNEDRYTPADNFGPQAVKVTGLRKNVEEMSTLEPAKSAKMFVDPQLRAVPSRYAIGDDFVKMFVMADLDPVTLLVTIYHRESDGVFIVYPDFNDLEQEYTLEIDQNSKQLYGYMVENLSVTVNEATQQLVQQKKLNKIQDETCELMKKLNVSKDPDFEFPKFCRIVLMLEIVDGLGFEYDNLHVQFRIKLPKFVRLVDGALEGSTHSSLRNSELWNFGFCHSLVIDIDDEFSLSSSRLDSLAINFEVISIDPMWKRERREGIASLKLPIEDRNDGQIFELSCLRDLQGGSWFWDFLERFFLGGIHKTQMLDQNHDGIVNFYGNKTVSTGTLRVKVHKVTQTKISRRSYTKMKSIDEIITSYHQAKARLQS